LVLERYDAIDAIPSVYRQAFDDSPSPFLDLHWFRLFEQHLLPQDRHCRYYLLRNESGEPLILLPALVGFTSRGTTGEIAALSNFYSGLYHPLTSGEPSPHPLKQLLQAIAQQEKDCWQIDLRPLVKDTGVWHGLREGLQVAGWVVEPFFCHGNWQLASEGLDFESYWNSRPSFLRKTCSRKARKLERQHGFELQLVGGGEALEPALDAFQAIYEQSWKQTEPFPAFIRDWCRHLARHQQLRLGLLTIEDRPVAAQIWLVKANTAYIFKLAHDPAFERFSPGSLLTQALMRQVIDRDRVARVDFLLGDDPYKADWMSHRGELWGLRAYRLGHPRGLAAGAVTTLARPLKALRAIAKNNNR
jgi:hypothetical protein